MRLVSVHVCIIVHELAAPFSEGNGGMDSACCRWRRTQEVRPAAALALAHGAAQGAESMLVWMP